MQLCFGNLLELEVSFDPSDFNDVADLWAGYQRGVQMQVLRDQARSLDEIRQVLGRQSKEQDRLDTLPKCPACKKPLELESEKCANCREEVCWVETLPFRKQIGDAKLNNFAVEAACLLDAQLNERFTSISQLARIHHSSRELFWRRYAALAGVDAHVEWLEAIMRSKISLGEESGQYRVPQAGKLLPGVPPLGVVRRLVLGFVFIAGLFLLLSSDFTGWFLIACLFVFMVFQALRHDFRVRKIKKADITVMPPLKEAVSSYNAVVELERKLLFIASCVQGVLRHRQFLVAETIAANTFLSGRPIPQVSVFVLPQLDVPAELASHQIEEELLRLEAECKALGLSKRGQVSAGDFWIKDGEVVKGAFTATEVFGLGKAKKLKRAHLIGCSEEGPFEPVEQLWPEIVKLAKSER